MAEPDSSVAGSHRGIVGGFQRLISNQKVTESSCIFSSETPVSLTITNNFLVTFILLLFVKVIVSLMKFWPKVHSPKEVSVFVS